MNPTFGSLFTGAGGFDLGFERAGFKCKWQVENNRQCNVILDRKWPNLRRPGDVKSFLRLVHEWDLNEFRVDVVCGGDPCPYRSRARTIHGTRSEDLWPEFLRIVSVLRPLWVLREHVRADDTDECAGMLNDRGYSVVVIEMDGSQITGHRRQREFICGVLASSGICPIRVFSQRQGDQGNPKKVQKTSPVASCLTTNPKRYDTRDNYILEPGRGMRILDSVERERLQGFDDGWTDCVSEWQRARIMGNALITHKAEWLARRIIRYHEETEWQELLNNRSHALSAE